MRGFYFEIAQKISEGAEIDHNALYKLERLVQERVTSLVANTKKRKGNLGAEPACFRHVMRRTLRFRKIVEQINVQDIVNGMPSIDIEEACYSESTVRRALRRLVESNLLIQLETEGGRVRFYGINIPFVFKMLLDLWKGVKPRGISAEDQVERLRQLEPLIEGCEIYYDRLMAISADDLSTFERNVETLCEEFKNEADSKEKKRQAKALRPLTGKQAGKVVIEQWNLQVEYREEMYPQAATYNTGKMRGMARNWVKELKEQGLDDAAIRARIERIVDIWYHHRGKHFQNPITGGGRNVPPVPNFEFYYANRQALDPMFLGTLPDRDYGGDKPNVLGNDLSNYHYGTLMPKKGWK